jgi:hypothetical protein
LGEERKGKIKRDRKRKEKWPGFFSPGLEAGHALMTVPGRILEAVRCN